MKINININEIVLDGFNIKNSSINKRKIVVAIEEELSRIFKEKEYTGLYKRDSKINTNPKNIHPSSSKDEKVNNDISLVDAGKYDLLGKINHDRMGIQIARSVYSTWHDTNVNNINIKKDNKGNI